MKTANVSELDLLLPSLLRWIDEGETVELTKGSNVIARVNPVQRSEPDPRKFQVPDFDAIQRTIMGENPMIYPDIVQEERDSYTT